jgi:hypothetical protein
MVRNVPDTRHAGESQPNYLTFHGLGGMATISEAPG